jgi:hypothetical protein
MFNSNTMLLPLHVVWKRADICKPGLSLLVLMQHNRVGKAAACHVPWLPGLFDAVYRR